jgi:hypothetical protein
MHPRLTIVLGGFCAASVIAAAWLVPLGAQQGASASASRYAQPKTPWGEPDFQGVWGGRNLTVTPLERSPQYGSQEFLTDEEVAARQKEQNDLQAQKDALVQRGEGDDLGLNGRTPGKDDTIQGFEYNTFWVDTGAAAQVFRRTSLITGPDGQIPYKPEVLDRVKFTTAVVSSRPPADFVNRSWRDRDMGERCITDGVIAMFWSGTGPTDIRQGPGYIVIRGEQFRDRRIIPTDGRAHGTIRSMFGEAVGHWEGDTLVVETKNFSDQTGNWPLDRFAQEYRTPSSTMHLLERFTRTADDLIEYQVTVTDTSKFTKPFTIEFPLMKSPTQQVYLEYACHEANYAMVHLLSQTRNLEKRQAGSRGKVE